MKNFLKYIGLWLVYLVAVEALFYVFSFFIVNQLFDQYQYDWVAFGLDMLYGGIFSALMLLLRELAHRFFKERKLYNWKFVSASVGVVIISIGLAYVIEYTLNRLIFPQDEWEFSTDIYIFSLVAACMSIVILIREYYDVLTRQQQRNRELELSLLKSQLDPHFMFNSLSTLSGLVDEQPATAHLFIEKLSGVYRYFTRYITSEKVSVEQEVSFIKDYVSLLDIRHPGHFVLEVSKDTLSCHKLIPTLSLQLAVENAVVHNKHSQANPLVISIDLKGDYVTVTNQLRPILSRKPGAGTGLKNLEERCEILSGQSIKILKTEDTFTLEIPLMSCGDNLKEESKHNSKFINNSMTKVLQLFLV